MSDYPDGSKLTESISGNWLRLAPGIRQGTFLIEMSDKVLLNIHVGNKAIDILMKDKDVFRYVGDLSFDGLDEDQKFMFYSQGIEHLHFNDHNIRIDNPDSNISSVVVKVSIEQFDKNMKKMLGEQ